MAKDLIVFKDTKKKSKIPKGDIFRKASTEQKFLGKTLPRIALGAVKFVWKHPISTTAAWLIGKKLLKTKPGLKFPKHRQFDKRGRKII